MDLTIEEAIEELRRVDTLDMPPRLCEAYYMSIDALRRELKRKDNEVTNNEEPSV